MIPVPRIKERRSSFLAAEAKFSTQRIVTYVLLFLFSCVVIGVFLGDDAAERSTVLQTVINFTLIAVGFWLGTSKSSADKDVKAAEIADDAVTPGPETPAGVTPAAEVVEKVPPKTTP